ncbi:MAG: ADP-ribosylglycohydrolase family protein [Polyangiales bacterium]
MVIASTRSHESRSIAALLGLAVGDAYGRPLEFVRGDRVRTLPVSIERGEFRWTDDTHMAMYLARAILDVSGGARPFDDDAFGHAVGARFIEWSHDPLTPSTAPGNTCLAGVAAYERGRTWRSSGVATSDGCGAVMRIAPLAMAFDGDTLTRAAEISSLVTHAHPNAVESAIAASHLLRWVLAGEALDAALVSRAIDQLHGSWNRGGTVAKSLETALAHTQRAGVRWLDEDTIWPGDGGWRSGSALGLAITAALAWGADASDAIDRGARIFGDSDSVACLVGMYLGAAGGLDALPADMVAVVPERGELEHLARACSALAAAIKP